MSSRLTIVLVTSNPAQKADVFAQLPWTVYGSQEDPARTAGLALKKGAGAIIYCPPDWTALKMMQSARQLLCDWPDIEVVVLSAQFEEVTIQALRADLKRKLNPQPETRDVSKALFDVLSQAGALPGNSDSLVGHSTNFLRVKEVLRRIAPFDTTVLITGETGTGKELAARAVHDLSPRCKQPFVSVNCAAIPEGLLESELFGFEKGAFTGAASKQPGKLRAAHGGTIFLDEIGDMSLATQAKILRALESREVQPLGGRTSVALDVRVVAATHQNLEQLMTEQRFRADLFFRLSVLPVKLPPLRERLDDIPELANHFIKTLNARYGRQIEGVNRDGMQMLIQHAWPGNIRQLRNVVEGAFLICCSRWITPEDLTWFPWKFTQPAPAEAPGPARQNVPGFSYLPPPPEPDCLLEALQATRWNKSQAAKLLHWSRMTLYRKIAKYRLSQDDPPPEISRQTALRRVPGGRAAAAAAAADGSVYRPD